MRSRLARFLVPVVALGILAGCGGSPKTPAPSATEAPKAAAPKEKVTLRMAIWTNSEQEVQFWTDIANQVTQKFPHIEMKFETDSFNNFWPKFQTGLAGGNAPDLVALHATRGQMFGARGAFVPLNDLIAKDKDLKFEDFNKGIVEALSFKGKVYALPYDYGPFMIYYNKTLFDKAGVKYPDENTTWDQFVDIAKKMTRTIDGKEVFGIAAQPMPDHALLYAYANGTQFAEGDKSILTNPAAVEAIQWYADLIHKHKVSAPLTDPSSNTWHRELFYAGRVAMYVDGPWNFLNVRSKLKDEWDIALMPKGKAGNWTSVTGSGFGIASTSKHKEEAWEALKIITSTESLTKLAKAGRGYPARNSALPAFYNDTLPPKNQRLIEKQSTMTKPIFANATFEETNALLKREFDKIFVAGQPVAETLKAMEPAFQQLLDKAAAVK